MHNKPGGRVVRRLFTTEEALATGLTMAALRWGERQGTWRRIERGVYGEGPEKPSPLDRAMAAVVLTGGVASGELAGLLLRLDGIVFRGPQITLPPRANGRRLGVRRRYLQPERIVTVGGVRCTDGLQTLVDLAANLDDLIWE